jgi:hypothetical protein
LSRPGPKVFVSHVRSHRRIGLAPVVEEVLNFGRIRGVIIQTKEV